MEAVDSETWDESGGTRSASTNEWGLLRVHGQLQVDMPSSRQLKPRRVVPMSEALNLLTGATRQAAKAFKSCSRLLRMRPMRRSRRAINQMQRLGRFRDWARVGGDQGLGDKAV